VPFGYGRGSYLLNFAARLTLSVICYGTIIASVKASIVVGLLSLSSVKSSIGCINQNVL